MKERLRELINPVHERRLRQALQRTVLRCIPLAAFTSASTSLLAVEFQYSWLLWLAVAILFAMPIAAWLWRRSLSLDWLDTARLIDLRCGWKDSISTAWDFAQRETPRPMERLHVNRAIDDLQRSALGDVEVPRPARRYAIPLVGTALAAIIWLVAMLSIHPDKSPLAVEGQRGRAKVVMPLPSPPSSESLRYTGTPEAGVVT